MTSGTKPHQGNIQQLTSKETDAGTSDFINIERSVKQGDKLACLFFCLVLAIVVKKTEEQNPKSGMRIGGEIISNLA